MKFCESPRRATVVITNVYVLLRIRGQPKTNKIVIKESKGIGIHLLARGLSLRNVSRRSPRFIFCNSQTIVRIKQIPHTRIPTADDHQVNILRSFVVKFDKSTFEPWKCTGIVVHSIKTGV